MPLRQEEDMPLGRPLKSDIGKLYARISGPRGHVFCHLVCASGSGLEIKLSNHEARTLGLHDAGEEKRLPQGTAEPMILSRRCDGLCLLDLKREIDNA